MKRQSGTVIRSVSLPADLTDDIERALYKHRRKICQQNTSRSKFIAMLIKKGLEAA